MVEEPGADAGVTADVGDGEPQKLVLVLVFSTGIDVPRIMMRWIAKTTPSWPGSLSIYVSNVVAGQVTGPICSSLPWCSVAVLTRMIHVHVGTIYTLEIPPRGMFQTPLLELDWEYQQLPWHNPAPSYFRKTSSSFLLLCPRLSLHSDAHFLLLSLCFRTFFGLILHTPKWGVECSVILLF